MKSESSPRKLLKSGGFKRVVAFSVPIFIKCEFYL